MTTATAIESIDQLDLEPIVYKLTHPEPGEQGLSLDQADRGVVLYRCFLKLCKHYPDTPIVPTKEIDHIWHAHISDTAKYRADCDHIFGRPLDHYPYAGMNGPDDRKAWQNNFATTRRLFATEFGIDLSEDFNPCKSHGGGGGACVTGIECEHSNAATHLPRPRPHRPRSQRSGN